MCFKLHNPRRFPSPLCSAFQNYFWSWVYNAILTMQKFQFSSIKKFAWFCWICYSNFAVFIHLNTVVHVTIRVGTLSMYMKWCQLVLTFYSTRSTEILSWKKFIERVVSSKVQKWHSLDSLEFSLLCLSEFRVLVEYLWKNIVFFMHLQTRTAYRSMTASE